jgi:hypothetical protein
MGMHRVFEALRADSHIRAAYDFLTTQKVGPVLLSGDIGTGKRALGMLLSLNAYHLLSLSEHCPFGWSPDVTRVIAVRTRTDDPIVSQLRDLAERYLSKPTVKTEFQALGRDVSVLGLNLCHIVFEHDCYVAHDERELVLEDALEHRVIARTNWEPPGRVVHIRSVASSAEWRGRQPGVMVDYEGPKRGVAVMFKRRSSPLS